MRRLTVPSCCHAAPRGKPLRPNRDHMTPCHAGGVSDHQEPAHRGGQGRTAPASGPSSGPQSSPVRVPAGPLEETGSRGSGSRPHTPQWPDTAGVACRLIARDTVDEKVLELQRSKRPLAETIVSADNASIHNAGNVHLPAGADSNLQRPTFRGDKPRGGSDLDGCMGPFERRGRGSALPGSPRRCLGLGNTQTRQRGPGDLAVSDRNGAGHRTGHTGYYSHVWRPEHGCVCV